MGIKKTFIGVPIYGNVNPLFHVAFTRFYGGEWDNERYPLFFGNPRMGDSLVTRARNSITAAFLRSDCTHLMFIDSDIGFRPDQVRKLIDDDKDIVGGLYCHKDCRNKAPKFVLNGLGPEVKPGADGLCEVRYVGTGFMLIARRVFEIMVQKFGKDIEYTSEDDHKTVEHDFWSVGVYKFKDGTKRYLSEDWMFCQRWRDLGGQVFADTNVLLEHAGSAIYPLPIQSENFLRSVQKTGFETAPGDASIPTSPGATDLVEVDVT
jgi:hypothetical protein